MIVLEQLVCWTQGHSPLSTIDKSCQSVDLKMNFPYGLPRISKFNCQNLILKETILS